MGAAYVTRLTIPATSDRWKITGSARLRWAGGLGEGCVRGAPQSVRARNERAQPRPEGKRPHSSIRGALRGREIAAAGEKAASRVATRTRRERPNDTTDTYYPRGRRWWLNATSRRTQTDVLYLARPPADGDRRSTTAYANTPAPPYRAAKRVILPQRGR